MQQVNRNELDGESIAVDFKAPETENPIPKKIYDRLLAIDGVRGVGIGKARELWVYVRDGNVRLRVPKHIDKFDIQVRVTGEVHAQQG